MGKVHLTVWNPCCKNRKKSRDSQPGEKIWGTSYVKDNIQLGVIYHKYILIAWLGPQHEAQQIVKNSLYKYFIWLPLYVSSAMDWLVNIFCSILSRLLLISLFLTGSLSFQVIFFGTYELLDFYLSINFMVSIKPLIDGQGFMVAIKLIRK